MIKKLLKRSLLQGVVFIILSGSLLVGADKKPKVLGQAPQKDQSYKKYNDLANTLHEEKKPTDETIASFKAALEKDKQFYSQRKQCKIELDLLLQDKMAQVEAYKIAPPAEPTDGVKNVATIAAAQAAGYPTFLSPKGRELLQKAMTPKETPSQTKPSTLQEQKPEAPKTTPAQPTTPTQPVTTQPTETIIQKPHIESELPPRESTPEKETVTTTPAPRKESELKAVGKELVPISEQQKIVSFVAPTFMKDVVQPFEKIAIKELELQHPEQAQKTEAALSTVQTIIPLLAPTEQVSAANAVAQTLALVEKPNGKKQIVEKAEQLIGLLDDRLPSANLHKNLKKINVDFGTEQSDTSVSRGGISNAVKQIAQSSLTLENTIPIIDTLQSAIAYDNYALMRATPELSTALVVANSPALTQKATELVIPMLDRYTELKTSFATRVQTLIQNFNDVPKVGVGWFEWFAKPDVNQQVGIIEQLLALYIGLQKVGREAVYGIEQTFNTMGYIMDSATIEQWEQKNQLAVAQKPSALRTELEESITYLRDGVIKKLIEKIQEPTKKNLLLHKLQANTVSVTEYYAQTQEKVDTQYWENVKAFTSAPVKKEPVIKPKPQKQRLKLPGIGSFETTTQPIEVKKPASETKIEPLSVEEEIELQRFETEPKEEPAVLPEPTALKATIPSARQQVDALKKEIDTLNIMQNSEYDVTKLQRKLKDIKNIDQKEQYALSDILVTKEQQIKRVSNLRDIINELDQKDAKRFKQAYQYFIDTLTAPEIQPFPENVYNELKKQFETAATKYATKLTKSLTKLIDLHEAIANDINQLDQLPDNLLETIKTLSELANFLDEGSKATLQNVFIGLCALYDSLLYTLFTYNKSSEAASGSTEVNKPDTITTYKDRVDYVKKELASRNYEEIVTNAFFPLLNEDTREKFRTGRYDLTKTNTVGLDINGAYIYELAENTNVAIDENKTIATLTAITPLHQKQYTTILEQWYNRIDKDDLVQKLIEFRDNPNNAYTPEQLQEIQDAINALQDFMPNTTFFNDLRKATTDSEAFKNAQKGVDIKNKITELKELIIAAHEKFKTSTGKKVVDDISFKRNYNSINKAINEDTAEDQRPALRTELNTVLTPYNAYLTDIARSYTKNLITLPARGFSNEPKLNDSINTINTEFTKITTFTGMLNELKDLLNTTNFETLYKELLKGYGSILATFDALNAKLVDTAKVEKGSFFSFTDKNNEKDNKTYEIAKTLMQLLDLSSKLRSNYADKLLEPYFSQATEMKNYTKGTLNVIDIGVENVGTKDAYRYARTQIEGYKQPADIIFPTGNHQQDYPLVIKKWTNFIELNFKKAAIRNRQKEVLDSLINILDSTILSINLGNDAKGNPIIAQMQLKNIHNFKKEQKDTIEYNFFDELTKLIKEKNLNPTKTIAKNIFIISTQITDDLINKIQQLKDDHALTEDITDKINAACGNSVALLDGLIYWIYTQMNDKNFPQKTVIIIATVIKEGIQPLAEQTKKLLPYTSDTFLPLYQYASKGHGAINISVYRYYIVNEEAAAHLELPGTINYRGINLFQTGKELSEDIITKQINTLNALIQSFQAPAQQPTKAPKINPLSTGTALLKPTAESISEVPTTPIIQTKPKAPALSNNLQAKLAETEESFATVRDQITDYTQVGLLDIQKRNYATVINDIQQNPPVTPAKENEMLKKLAEIQKQLRSLQPKRDIYTPDY